MSFPDYVPSEFPAAIRWHTIKIPPTDPLVGYVAGKAVGAKVHLIANASRPCVEWYTGGEEFCPYCERLDLQEKAYLPFYLEPTWDRKVIIISKTTFADARWLEFGVRFTAVKNQEKGKASLVRRAKTYGTPQQLPRELRDAGPQDIKEYLNHLWGLSARKAWKPTGKKKPAIEQPGKAPATSPPADAVDQESARELLNRYRWHIGKGGEAA